MRHAVRVNMMLAALLVFTGAGWAQQTVLHELERAYVRLHEQIGPTVVNIETSGPARSTGNQFEEFFHFFGVPMPEGQPQAPRPRGQGSGFVYDKDGHIITNNHVVEGAEEITVRFWNGKEYDAEIVGRDPEGDLAVLKINPEEDLPVAKLGDSDNLKVGQFAIAIGSARGFEGTVSYGHISAVGREGLPGLRAQGLTFQNLIQTDAAINLGNSGGPLCNIDGEVVGINTAIVWGANSIGFAIPVNTAKRVVPQLISQGKVTRGYLGVAIEDAKNFVDVPELALPDDRGAIVTEVQPDTPAEEAGFETYDVIRKVNGKEIENAADLVRTISGFMPGATVTLEIWRDQEAVDVDVVLKERDLVAVGHEEEEEVLGLTVRSLTPEIMERLEVAADIEGVLVTRVAPGTPAEEAQLRAGDIITEVAKEPVTTPEEFFKKVRENGQPGKQLLLRYIRGGASPRITTIEIPKKD